MSSMPTTSVTTTGHNTMLSTRSNSTHPRPPVTLTGLNFNMPVDDEQYLIPSSSSPHSKNTPTNNNNPYMELVGDTSQSQQPMTMFQYPPPQSYFTCDNPNNYGRVPEQGIGNTGILPSMDNPEYIWNSNNSTRGDYHTLGIPLRGSANNGSPASSQGPSSIHSVTSNPPNSANNLPSSLASSGSNGGRQSSGLNGVVNSRMILGGGSHPISPNDMENGPHEYYNEISYQPPLKLQPPPKGNGCETTV